MKASTLFTAFGYEDLVPLVGKAPTLKDWVNFEAGEADVRKWDKQSPNLGLLTANFPAIDCDVTDEQVSRLLFVAVREVFGLQIPLRVGLAPKFLALTRLADGIPPFKKSVVLLTSPEGEQHKIEVLGQGQQFVIEGIHPETKKPYKWINPLVHADELPEFTEEKYREFISVVEHKLGLVGWTVGARTDSGTRANVDPTQLYAPSMEFLAAAVKTIPNTADTSRDTYVAVAHNIKGSTPPEYDQAGFDIFTEWASKYPAPDMQHDLKLWDGIDRDGISTGWDRIRLLAEDVGEWDGTLAAVAQAQAEFDVVEEEPEEYDGQLTLAEVTDHSILAQHISEQGRDYFTSGNHDWFVWNGVRWRPDPMKAEHTKGRIALQLDLIANELMDKYAGGKKVMTAINSLHSVGMINAVFARIGMQEGVYRDRDMLNHTEWYKYTLNTPTGTYDLRTMEVRDHQRLNYITQITSVLPDFDDQCPEFMKFLLSSCGGDEQLVRYVLAVLGASLTADTQDRYIWFLTGESGAGKSTLLKHVHAILGDYAGICPQGALVHGEQAAHQSAVAGFRDKRFIHGSEIDRGQKWNVALMKSITGNEIITARRLYHEYEEFTVVGKVIIAGNETPTLANVDSAVRERLRLIQFVAPEESDPKLDEKLRKEYPAILALLMKSAQVWIEEGYPHCEAVQTLTEEYFREEDLVGQFRDHYFLVTGTEAFVSNKDVHDLWEQFTTLDQRKEHNIKGIKTLSRALRSSDSRVSTHMQRIDGKVTRGLQGLTLRENINIPASLEDLM